MAGVLLQCQVTFNYFVHCTNWIWWEKYFNCLLNAILLCLLQQHDSENAVPVPVQLTGTGTDTPLRAHSPWLGRAWAPGRGQGLTMMASINWNARTRKGGHFQRSSHGVVQPMRAFLCCVNFKCEPFILHLSTSDTTLALAFSSGFWYRLHWPTWNFK
jgi:hypothetical protein